jgi:hypothetical protein
MRVFVSHSHEEFAIANAIKHQFDLIFAEMVDVFLSEDIPLGADWLMAIRDALQKADVIVVLFSPSSQSRPWINIEAGYGVMAGKPVIPVCCLGLKKENLPTIYGLRQALYPTDEGDVLKLLESVASATPARRLLVEDRNKAIQRWVEAVNSASASVPAYIPAFGDPVVVWVTGSVNELEEEYRNRAFKTAAALAKAFISRGYRVVLGRNVLLNYLADRVAAEDISSIEEHHGDLPQLLAAESAQAGLAAPNPLIILGSLRSPRGIRRLFMDSIGRVPDVAIVLGGTSRGRAFDEAEQAKRAGIPVLPLSFTGGAAAEVEPSMHESLGSQVAAIQAMKRGSDVIGSAVCDVIDRQATISRQANVTAA